MIIAGVVLNTTFLVREIRRNEQHDAFINAVTHELKTPVASIRLYVETLQTRTARRTKRNEFYGIILSDSDRLLGSIEQILRTGRVGSSSRKPHLAPMNLDGRREGMRGACPHPAPHSARGDGIRARASAADPRRL